MWSALDVKQFVFRDATRNPLSKVMKALAQNMILIIQLAGESQYSAAPVILTDDTHATVCPITFGLWAQDED